MNRHIQRAIGFHTNQIAKTFKLDPNDREDIRQELTVTALEAETGYDPSQKVKIQTYIKMAISYQAIDIMRALERRPQIICFEEQYDLQEIETYHERIQRDVHEELSHPEAPVKRKSLQINCGPILQTMVISPEDSNAPLRADLEIAFGRLTSRQRLICRLLMLGLTQRIIARILGVHECTVRREMGRIRKVFASYGFDKY